MFGKLVPVPSGAVIPERDIGKRPILNCINLGVTFGGLKAVDDFNLMIGRTEIAGLIGPNGAGKTTVFNLLTKVYQPTHGTILLDGQDTHNMTTAQVNRAGIARTFQNIRLFNDLTVEENVTVAMDAQMKYNMVSGIFRLPSFWKEEKVAHERALELLSLFHMEDLTNVKAGSLPYGAQRRLEIVRALATNPSLLLLDEPAAGMNPSETAELMENIRKIRDTFQIAIMLIEHDMNLVMNICEGICVLNFGKVIAKLKETGLMEKTIVMFTTDHGVALPFNKCNLTDSGIGVSLIMRVPGAKANGQVIDALVSHVDVMPTLCDLLQLGTQPGRDQLSTSISIICAQNID